MPAAAALLPQAPAQSQPLRDLGPEAALVLAYRAAQNRSLFAAQVGLGSWSQLACRGRRHHAEGTG
jgi:hypothetical protein